MKMMQNQHKSIKDSLNYIISTLNTETKLQDKDDKLNFGVEQLEMIMKSYRFDINLLRKLQIICFCATFIIFMFVNIIISFSLKYDMSVNSMLIMCIFLIIVTGLLLAFGLNISSDLHKLEKEMENMRQSLWEIHYKIYENKIYKEYTFDK